MKKRHLLFCGIVLLSACKQDPAEEPQVQPPEELPKIVINEFLASNTACCSDTDGDMEEYNDWIELYNADDEAVNIAGWYVSDNKDIPKKFQIADTDPAKTTIAPGGYLILWADNQPEQGVLHLDFKLSASGENVGIYAPDGRTVDEYTFPAQTTDVSTGRLPNGSGSFTALTTPSPGSPNQ